MNVKTPLNAWQHAHGGRMVDFAGAELPVLFTSIVQEHQAVRADAGWFDVSHRGEVFTQGAWRGCLVGEAGYLQGRLPCIRAGSIWLDVSRRRRWKVGRRRSS